MNDLVVKQNTVGVITLKEITDLINVQHSKAMLKVEQLSKEPSFGEVAKMDTLNLNNVKVETYLLNKKQAIAVGAKLNNSLLMKVIDRLEELENQNKPKTTLDLIIQSAQEMQKIKEVQSFQENRIFTLEQTRRLENWQEKQLQDSKNFKVYEILKSHNFENDKEMERKLHSRVWKAVKKKFNVPRYNEVPSLKFNEANDYIRRLTFGELV